MSDQSLDFSAVLLNDITPAVEEILASFDTLGSTLDEVSAQMSAAMDVIKASVDSVAGSSDGVSAQVSAAYDEMASSAEGAAATIDAANTSIQGSAEETAAASESAASASAGSIQSINMALLAAGVIIAGTGVAAAKMAGDFQSGMTTLVTGAGESQSNMQMVSDGILNLATATGESTQQLTAGMFMIESAGYHGAAGLDILQAAAEGAKVGNADLGTVADATTTILNDFGSTGITASNAVNELIATVASGKTHMQDLGQSLSQILPTASSARVGLSDVMGAMATMTGEGVPAANAATYLRQTILALDAPSKAAEKALKNVGLSTAEVSSEMQVSLPDTLKMITDAVGKKFPVGSAAYVAALKDISGGTKTMQGMLDLTGDHLTAFERNVVGIAGSVKGAGHSIQGWGLVQQDFNFKMDHAKEVVEVFMIKLGTELLPVLGRVADTFANTVMPALARFGDFLEQNRTALAVVAGILGGIVLAAIVSILAPIAAAVAAAAPLIGIFAGIGAAAGLVATHWSDLVNAFNSSSTPILAIKGVLLILTGILIAYAASAIPSAIAAIGASIVAFGAQAVAAGAAAIATLAAAAPFIIVGVAIGAVIGIIILLITHWKQVTAFLQTTWKAIETVATQVWGAISNFFTATWNHITSGVTSFVDGIQRTLLEGFTIDKQIVTGVIRDIVGIFSWLYAHNYYFKALVDFITNVFTNLRADVITIWTAIQTFLRAAWSAIQAVAAAVFQQISVVIITPLRQTWAAIQAIVGLFIGTFQAAWSTIVTDARTTWSAFVNAIQSIVGGVGNAIQSVISAITGPLTGIASAAFQWGSNIISGFVKGITSMIGAAGNAAKNVVSSVASFLGFHSPAREGPGAELDTWGPGLVQGFADGMVRSAQMARDAASVVIGGVANTMHTPMNPSGAMAMGSVLAQQQAALSMSQQASGSSAQHIHIHLEGDLATGMQVALSPMQLQSVVRQLGDALAREMTFQRNPNFQYTHP